MSVMFQGGPMDGQMGGEPPPDPAAMMGGPPEEASGESEGELFVRILADARTLLGLGTVSEQNKLLLEKATTLIQQIQASEEKEGEAAMGGKLSPGILRKIGGGGGF